MSSFNAFIEFIFSIVELLANGASGETENGGMPTNLMPVRLQFHCPERGRGLPLGLGRETGALSWSGGWC
jgi:hypothetical protein